MTTQNTKSVKGYKGMAMEGVIASWYAKNTLNDVGRHEGMARKMVGLLKPGASVLEVAPGPGYFCIALAKLGDFKITGLDISQSFVSIATKNAETARVRVDFKLGNASAMPLPDSAFDLIFCQAAFKNFSQPVQAIAEMYRVLKPGGTAVIVDMRRDAEPAAIDQNVRDMQLSPLNAWFTRLSLNYLMVKSAHTVGEMRGYAEKTGFGGAAFDLDGIGFQMRLTKKPGASGNFR